MAANWTDFVSGNVLTAAQLNGVVDNFADIAIFNETQASGTNGGASVATTFTKRVLNTTNINNITGCSIASSVITLPAGSYYVQAWSPLYKTDQTQIRLRNTTDGTNAIVGMSHLFANIPNTGGTALLAGYVTIAASKNFELQYYATLAVAGNGLGTQVGSGIGEVYSTVQIQRVA